MLDRISELCQTFLKPHSNQGLRMSERGENLEAIRAASPLNNDGNMIIIIMIKAILYWVFTKALTLRFYLYWGIKFSQ